MFRVKVRNFFCREEEFGLLVEPVSYGAGSGCKLHGSQWKKIRLARRAARQHVYEGERPSNHDIACKWQVKIYGKWRDARIVKGVLAWQ